jgi:iron complex outermembrane receptor protein
MTNDLIELLHSGTHSLVVANGDIRIFDGHGVSDLYRLLKEDSDFLKGASIVDKIVGKAAAALMILAEIKEVHADVISQLALDLFAGSGISVSYVTVVPHIINKKQTGWCPLETRCRDSLTPQDCLYRIEEFIKLQNNK